MAIDVHAHYLPGPVLERLGAEGARLGVEILGTEPACRLRFAHGLELRPFFPKLVEEPARRLAGMDGMGIDRQILSGWTDMFAYGLDAGRGAAWHRLLNEELGAFCQRHPDRFSWLASGHLADPAAAARELDRAVRHLGAVGGVAATHVEGTNLGELPLDEYWAAATGLDVPVLLHPMQPVATPRTARFALNQIVHYPFDTTLGVGSLLATGVLDRFPRLGLVLAHGGGALPYLLGRFDVMHGRVDHAVTGIVAVTPPTAYVRRLYYDTLLHAPHALRYLASLVGVDRLVIGTDDSFPPADHDPLGSLRAAGFSPEEIRRIGEGTPRRLFRLPD